MGNCTEQCLIKVIFNVCFWLARNKAASARTHPPSKCKNVPPNEQIYDTFHYNTVPIIVPSPLGDAIEFYDKVPRNCLPGRRT